MRFAAAEHLALECNGRLSIRGVVRQTVELFDLLPVPGLRSNRVGSSLRQQMR
ncbi:MAG: hypothetical protein H6647_06265 [Anaerolineales bacterium]|nr:hypothetical protein [Anaerolineales bacterium]